jgi:hypothetical protein
MKSTSSYWNALAEEHSEKWEVIEGSDGKLLKLMLAEDQVTGDCTRLTKFKDGYSTRDFGVKSHDYLARMPVGHRGIARAICCDW